MRAAQEMERVATAPAATARPKAALARAEAPALARRAAARLGDRWLPRAGWTISRTGRPGLVGLALLLAAALFLFSTHLKVVGEVEALRAELAAARSQSPSTAADKATADPATALRALPARSDMPAILRQLFNHATQARLAIDTGRYEIKETRSGGVVRTHVSFPVTGPYPQIRTFIDTTLATMPEVALGDLAIERKSIADGEVEAQVRMIVYSSATGPAASQGTGSGAAEPGRQASPRASAAGGRAQAQERASPLAPEKPPASDRVVAPTHAAALFAQHSWTVLKPQPLPPPPPPPPPPDPTAPPLPYTFVGSYAPAGEPPVFFLARGDHVIDARIGDQLEGDYQLESAAGGQLVFVYLPLNIRQNIPAGVTR